MKQSAVEFSVEKLAKLIPSGNQLVIHIILQEAKEMEKQQIMDAFVAGVDKESNNGKNFEQYYNETFKQL